MSTHKAERIVVKVGSNTLTDEHGALDHHYIATLVEQIAQLRKAGHEVVLVTSAAIAAGLEVLHLDGRPDNMPDLQACASVGQVALIEMYAAQFGRRGIAVGQVLLTKSDLDDEAARAHARDTFERLLALGALPIVNENDTVAVEEIAFGDNDTLAALVACVIEATQVIILTDIDGLHACDPAKDPTAPLIPLVHKVTDELIASAQGSGSAVGSGGMRTKLEAARTLLDAGIICTLCDGRLPNVVCDAVDGKAGGTVFAPSTSLKNEESDE
ncbi:MAG: glutamate 5-kinase [Coriobacteriia bacterium]|nr:glutamate 5-kinase [Coriobacteriia bacterium]